LFGDGNRFAEALSASTIPHLNSPRAIKFKFRNQLSAMRARGAVQAIHCYGRNAIWNLGTKSG
jgi:hypothetical protein